MNSSWLNDMFMLTLPLLEKMLRPVIVYAFLIIGLRLAGKRELAQLNPFDLVVLLTLSNTVQNAIIGNDNSVTGGLIGAATLLLVNYLVVRFLYGHRRLDEVVEGRSDFLIQHGVINPDVMKRELITEEELKAAARRQGYSSLSEIESASLEPGGAIAFLAHEPAPEDLRHKELLERIEYLTGEVKQLRENLGQAPVS
jgi:uncharacterized membrane protein YcaP (DUF421 family)